MKPGPPKTPTAILMKRGSWRAKTRPKEPKVSIGIPKAPKGLNPDCKRLWKHYGSLLADMGVLTENDATALLLLVNAHATYIKLSDFCLTTEPLYRTNDPKHPDRKGTLLKNPAFGMCDKAFNNLLKLCKEFGITPAARSNVEISEPKKEDTLESKYFSGPNPSNSQFA